MSHLSRPFRSLSLFRALAPTKRCLRYLGVFALGVLSLGLAPEDASAGTTYRMYCKGRFKVEAAKSHMWIRFSKAPSGSWNGSSLANGQCAWADRALNSSEPATINFSYSMGKAVIPALIECSRESGCVMGFFAEKRGPGLWADVNKQIWLQP